MKEKHIEKYPIHNPDDESSGMDLVDKEEGKKQNTKPGEFTFFPFEDWLKQANSFSGKHDFKFNDKGEQVDENMYPQGSSFGRHSIGMTRNTSPYQLDRTMGSEKSGMRSARPINPLEALDIKAVKERLPAEKISKLEKISDIIGMNIDDIIKGAIDDAPGKKMSVSEMIDKLIIMYL